MRRRRRHTKPILGLHPSAHGGVLRKKRRGRGARSVSIRYSMHIVLRSSEAKYEWSFVQPRIRQMIERVLAKHASRTETIVMAVGNAGNHLHLRLKFTSREQYKRFIRAVTGEIALKIKQVYNVLGRCGYCF